MVNFRCGLKASSVLGTNNSTMYTRCVTDTHDAMGMFLILFICRVCFVSTQTYDTSEIPTSMLSSIYRLEYDNAPQTTISRTSLTVRDMLLQMKLNWFPQDWCSARIKVMMRAAPSHRSTNAYILALFTSRAFVRAFHDSGAYRLRKTLHGKLSMVRDSVPIIANWFTTSFNPQRRLRWTYSKYSRQKSWLEIKKLVTGRPPKIKVRHSDGTRKTKRDLCKEVRELKSIGPFLGKNLVQWLALGVDHKLVPDMNDFTECGPGARAAINTLSGWPRPFSVSSPSWSSAEFYNVELQRIRKLLLKHPELKPRATDTATVKAAKQLIKEQLCTGEGTQFLLCEMAKTQNYELLRSVIYTRGYWDTADVDVEADSDVEE